MYPAVNMRYLPRFLDFASQIPGVEYLKNCLLNFREDSLISGLLSEFDKPFQGDNSTNVIVSLTSFPARIEYAWIPIETIFRQKQLPWKVVLVLAEKEFPNKKLPERICAQAERGLEILWVKNNTKSYKKLLPTREKYPNATIVTFDDDIIYEPWRLSQLLTASKKRPDTIIGHRGWVLTFDASGLRPYIEWPCANQATSSDFVFLTGAGGILYPPQSLPLDLLLDVDLAERLCPTTDDIWFWIVTRKAAVPLHCLGNHKIHSIRRLKGSPELFMENRLQGQNDVQLSNVIKYFGLQLR